MKQLRHLLTLLLLVSQFQSLNAEAKDREKQFRKGRGGARGNERSAPVRFLSVGTPNYSGTGCPQGTMQIVFSPDFLSFSLLFDQFVAESNGEVGLPRDVLSCESTIPIQLPPGLQMEITRVDFRGFVGLPANTRAVLNSQFNFRGPRQDSDKISLHYRFNGPLMEDYLISTDTLGEHGPASQTELSPCGGSVKLRIFNQLKIVAGRESNEPGTVTIDSVDGASNALYFVNWKACTPEPREARRRADGKL